MTFHDLSLDSKQELSGAAKGGHLWLLVIKFVFYVPLNIIEVILTWWKAKGDNKRLCNEVPYNHELNFHTSRIWMRELTIRLGEHSSFGHPNASKTFCCLVEVYSSSQQYFRHCYRICQTVDDDDLAFVMMMMMMTITMIWHFTSLSTLSHTAMLVLVLEPGYTLSLQTVDPDQLASSEASRSGSALFVIKHLKLYQQPGSSNLIGWKLEVGGAS